MQIEMSKIPKNTKFKASEIVHMTVFDLLKSAKIIFMQNQSSWKIARFPHCGISTVKIAN